jgi:hypothetical protein
MRSKLFGAAGLFLVALVASAFAFSWSIPAASGVSLRTAPPVNSISGSYGETKLRSGPDSLCRVGHYRDTLNLIPIFPVFRPRLGMDYVLSWAPLTGRQDSTSLAIYIIGYSADGKMIAELGDSAIVSPNCGQYRIPFMSQILAHHFSVTLFSSSDAGQDSTKPVILHEFYLQWREPSK